MSEKEGFSLIFMLFLAIPAYLAFLGPTSGARLIGKIISAPLLVGLLAIWVL